MSDASGQPAAEDSGDRKQCNGSLLTRIVRKQIENSLRESAPKAMDVTNAVLELNEHLQRLSKVEAIDVGEREVWRREDDYSKCVNSALVGLQFYDRLSQQLGQAISTLERLELMLDNGDQVARDLDCTGLAESARKRYPTESERDVFDRELGGKSNTWQSGQASVEVSGVELFD